mgnify:CR=1 FL=1|jgi:hypothetical protein
MHYTWECLQQTQRKRREIIATREGRAEVFCDEEEVAAEGKEAEVVLPTFVGAAGEHFEKVSPPGLHRSTIDIHPRGALGQGSPGEGEEHVHAAIHHIILHRHGVPGMPHLPLKRINCQRRNTNKC